MMTKWIASCLLFLFPWCAWAQQAIVKGTITDAVNKEVLTGATISLLGSNNSTVTDVNGEFFIYAGSGTRSLVVRYLGYSDSTITLELKPNETRVLRIGLSSSYARLSSVIVMGLLQGQAKALNQQKNADNIRNVIASDQIGRFPDPNAAEALQRVPGVNIERDQGEGRYVFVRGLAPQFTNVSVNGEQIPSPEADVRFVALDAIPADQLASIEVSKSLTPDMDGDAVGGSVNLITRTAQSKKPRINASLAGGYNQLMRATNIQGQLQYAQRLGNKEKLGVLFNSSYYHNDLGSDNIERSPQDNEVELRDYSLTRTRLGLSSTIDYRFNPRHEVYLRALYSRFTDREWRRRYVFKPEDEEIEKLTKDRFEAQSITTINLGAKHNFNSFFLNYEAQFSNGRQNTPYDNEIGFIAGIPSVLGFKNPKYPSITADDFTDNKAYELDEAGFGHTLAKDRNITAKFDLGIPYKLNNNSGLIKVGAKLRRKEKSYSITQDYYEAIADVPTLDAFEEGPIKSSFLGGRYELGKPLSVGSFINYFNANPAAFASSPEDKAIDEALEAYDAEEHVVAAYAMARQQFNKLMVLGGVRYERTKVSYHSKDVVIDGAGDLQEIVPVTGSSSYDFLLPQASVRYQLSKFTNLRAAATFSYARPNFSEIIPSQEINQEDNIATAGNAALKPVKAFNLDLLGEHYFGNVGVLSGGFFYKRLNDFIYRRVLFNSPYPLAGTPYLNSIDVVQAQNGNQANVTGFEFAFQNNLSFLPGALKYFSLYVNYTYAHSAATLQSRTADAAKPNTTEKLRLPGQATHVGNISLAFERKKFNARVSFNFNGEYLSEVGATSEEDVFVKDRLQADISAGYAFNAHWRLFAEVLNITNQPFERYMATKDQLIQREYYRQWGRFGVKFDW
ncbi:TonB-dependent receptor [Paraflavitalea sp. CAU 1676]|uniref:TonB-dependent receptor n=1 Tax=Paraflavitalea sp. CAU 1676 TaxID=3032598 RepID=UPI0023D9CF33|nr:TonB-dependent receptor [Paraflavitalea sp. CAU 1676]MDF2187604.1 TonB-dependent receptor [Paraflavitalea sp. CAU 1676]